MIKDYNSNLNPSIWVLGERVTFPNCYTDEHRPHFLLYPTREKIAFLSAGAREEKKEYISSLHTYKNIFFRKVYLKASPAGGHLSFPESRNSRSKKGIESGEKGKAFFFFMEEYEGGRKKERKKIRKLNAQSVPL